MPNHEDKLKGENRQLPVTEGRLFSVLDTAVDGIIVIDDQSNVLSYNKACQVMFGYAAEEVVGQNVSLIMPENFAVQHDQFVSNYLTTGERKIIGLGREVEGKHKDGRVFPLELSVGEAHTVEGRQFIGIMRDLTARREAEERIADLRSQVVHMARISAVNEMSAAITHELNQPLTAAQLYLQAAMKQSGRAGRPSADPAEFEDAGQREPDLEEILGKAFVEVKRAGEIIQHMRRFLAKGEPDRSRVGLTQLVNSAVELTRLGTASNDVEFRMDFPDKEPHVDADPVQIQQVVVNLVRNAVQAVEEQAKKWVGVTVRRSADLVRVEVMDSGSGIPTEVLGSLFTAFTSTRPGGLGLGLAISRTIAQSHGGDLWADADSKSGARFILELPLNAAPGYGETDNRQMGDWGGLED